MPLRYYSSWNIGKFCDSYFKLVTDHKSTLNTSFHATCDKPLTERCASPAKMERIADEIRISFADCRMYADGNKKMTARFKEAEKVVHCALECFNMTTAMPIEDYIKMPEPANRMPILLPFAAAAATMSAIR